MKNPMYEQALKRLGVEFKYHENVRLDQINHDKGRMMQARLQPLDTGLIDSYREMIKEGSKPPPLIIHKPTKQSKYVPLDGNQRIEANRTMPKEKQISFSAYEILTEDPMIVDRVCWQFNNTVNGRRLSYDECMGHAITFVRKYNQPVSPTAKDWGVKDWELASKCRSLEIQEIAAKNHIDLSKTPQETIAKLSTFRAIGDDVMIKVAKCVAESGVSASNVQELAQEVSKAKTLDSKTQLVDDFVNSEKVIISKAATKGGRLIVKQGRSPKEKLQKKLEEIESLVDDYQIPAFKPIGKTDQEKYAAAALLICNKLIAIYGLGSLINGQSIPQ